MKVLRQTPCLFFAPEPDAVASLPRLICFIGLLCLVAAGFVAVGAQTTNGSDDGGGPAAEVERLIKQGQTDEAVKILQTELAKDPENGTVNYKLGKIFYQRGKYESANERLSVSLAKLDKTSSAYAETVQMAAMSHYILGHVAESIPLLEQGIKLAPGNRELVYALGVGYIQTRQPDKSRETYARLFGVDPASASAYMINGHMHIRQRFEETAELELNQAVKLDARLPQANFHLGELAIYRAEIDKGIAFLQKEISLNPSNSMAYYRLGEALSRQLKWDDAIPPLQRSIWLNPIFSGPYIVLGKVYLRKSDLGNAELMLRRSVAMDPNNFGAHHLLAQVLQRAGRIDEAKREFSLAEQLRGSSKDP